MKFRKNVILVLGLPCSGKTTLSKAIAKSIDADHISVGDLIRNYFHNNGIDHEEHTKAFEGEAVFQDRFVAMLIQDELERRNESDTLVMDAGPPIDKVITTLNVNIKIVFFLHVSEGLCQQRFAKRMLQDNRFDDHMSLYSKRTDLYKRELGGLYRFFNQTGKLRDLDGNCNNGMVIQQALSYLLLDDVESSRVQTSTMKNMEVVERKTIGGSISDLISSSVSDRIPYLLKFGHGTGTHHPESTNHMLLLLKPGLSYPKSLYSYLLKKIEERGYKLGAAVCWDRNSLKETGVARAHFDRHYINARWGDLVVPGGSIGSRNLTSAYEYAAMNGIESLIDKWEDHAGLREKVRQSLWMKDIGECVLLNGHIPNILLDYEERTDYVLAFHLYGSSHYTSWKTMRGEFLGSTDPATAVYRSLRHEALIGSLKIGGEISIRNNAFHLSAGPLEGYRELLIWFGWDYLRSLSLPYSKMVVVDRPMSIDSPDAHTLYEITNGMDMHPSKISCILESLKERLKA